MKEKFKLNRQIYFILGSVLILALVIQTTRLESFFKLGGTVNGWNPPEVSQQDVLTSDEVARLGEGKLLVLFDSDETYSVRVKDNADHMLRYMKKNHDVVDASAYTGEGEGYDGVILTLSDMSKLSENAWIDRFAEQGGHVFFAAMPLVDSTFYRLYRKMGINEVGDYVISKGLAFESNVLVNYKGESFSGNIVENTSLQLQLSKDAKIHATSQDGFPLLWEMKCGEGSFVVFNGTMLQEKSSRGFMTGAIQLMKEDGIYPIMNLKLMYIDDFPAPMPKGIQSDIFRIYKRNMERFFKEVWWPDMIRIQSRFGLKYTGLVIQSYDNITKAPFQAVSEADNLNLITFGRELLKRGGEIGIHGYNHQSLATDERILDELGYKMWNSRADMEQSVRTVVDFVNRSLPNYGIHNYVPPSNVLDAEGRAALKAGWPELKSISSVYSEDSQNMNYVQEFEIADDGIVELPRITSGFKKDEFNEWAMANAASSLGVFSHFIHPDDILDRERSFPFTWEQLYEMFEEYLETVNDKYGWLRSITATDASMELEKYELSEPHFKVQGNRIDGYINQYAGGKYYYLLRSSKKITRNDSCRLTRLDEETYLVEANSAHFVIGLEG